MPTPLVLYEEPHTRYSDAPYRPRFVNGKFHISREQRSSYSALVTGSVRQGDMPESDAFGLAFGIDPPFHSATLAAANDRITLLLGGTNEHEIRSSNLNQLGADSLAIKQLLTRGRILTNGNAGVAAGATGVGVAASWVAMAPVHAATLGLLVPLHVAASVAAPLIAGGTAAAASTRVITWAELRSGHNILEQRRQILAAQMDHAKNHRQGTSGANVVRRFGEPAWDAMKTAFQDTDDAAIDFSQSLQRVETGHGNINSTYSDAGAKTASALAYFTRIEEARLASRLV